jgi:cytochrome P450
MTYQLLWRPLDKEKNQDPYPMYRRLREESPVHPAQTGEWIISRYEDVKSVLKDLFDYESDVAGKRFEGFNNNGNELASVLTSPRLIRKTEMQLLVTLP